MPEIRHPAEPTAAERARTVLAHARVASLVTRGCGTRSGTATVVAIEDQPDGRPLIRLGESALAVRQLLWCPVATLSITAPGSLHRLELTGPLQRVPGRREGRDRFYRLTPLSGRLAGPRAAVLAVAEFECAEPDPLYDVAPDMLEHLTSAHSEDLLACIRAHGHDYAEAVQPSALDRYGIEVAVFSQAGAGRLRLAFPGGPVDSLEQVPHGHLIPVGCRCHAQGET